MLWGTWGGAPSYMRGRRFPLPGGGFSAASTAGDQGLGLRRPTATKNTIPHLITCAALCLPIASPLHLLDPHSALLVVRLLGDGTERIQGDQVDQDLLVEEGHVDQSLLGNRPPFDLPQAG